jgi:hypothetical protein
MLDAISAAQFHLAENWYGDGEPSWTEGVRNRPAKTSEQAAAERRQVLRLLKKHNTDPAASDLRRRLRRCAGCRRCMSPACPECRRAYQRLFVCEASSFLSRQSGSLSVVSLVPAKLRIREGGLQAQDPFRSLRSLLDSSLAAAQIDVAIGGFDLSLNEHHTGGFASHWSRTRG